MPGVMITEGGPHSAEKWAVMTGEHIFPIDLNSPRAVEAKKVQMRIIEALMPHHEGNMATERSRLASAGDAHLETPYTPTDVGKAALAQICSILAGTPWQDKGNDPTWQRVVYGELCTHFATAQDIERQWHCQRSKSPTAKAWLAKKHPAPEEVN